MRASVVVSVVLVACGGATQANGGPHGGLDSALAADGSPGQDAGPADVDHPADTSVDAPADAPAYPACFGASGQLDNSLKRCQSTSDCVLRQEQTDCCGTILYVGVSTASAAKYDACEASLVGSYPPCGCASGQTKTEDGKVAYPGRDAGAPQVHCTSSGVCLSFVM